MNPEAKTKADSKKKNSKKLLIWMVIGFVLLIFLIIFAIYMYLHGLYSNMYDPGRIEERTDEYTVDILNPPDIVSDNITHYIEDITEGEDVSVSETDAPDTELTTEAETTVPVSVTTEEQISASETEIITYPPETEEPSAVSTTKKPQQSSKESTSKKETVTYNPDSYVGSIPIYYENQIDPNITNFLIVGRDAAGYYGRADSAMLISYNKKTGDIKITSLLRDCYVPIEGHSWNKLGHALSYGGMGLYINTVNYVLDLDVQKYAVVKFEGLTEIVDYIGGITLNFTKEEAAYYADFGVKAGDNVVSGKMALLHARNRYLGGDFARAERQRDVLLAIYEKIVSMNYNDAMDAIKKGLGYLKTNIDMNEAITLASSVLLKGGFSKITSAHMPFEGTWNYAYVKPPGYSGSLAVTKIDIAANRKAIKQFIYG